MAERDSHSPWASRTSRAILLIRVLVGWVFLSEGIQKFLFPDSLGVGRFVKIGIPWPQVMTPLVGVAEVVCGSFLLIGFITRLASVPLLIRYCGRHIFDQDCHVRKERVLGDAPRSPHGFEHAAGFNFPAAGWRWRVVPGCMVGRKT
jgi:hypothetical protein